LFFARVFLNFDGPPHPLFQETNRIVLHESHIRAKLAQPHSGKAHQENLTVLFDKLKEAMKGYRFVVGGDINAARGFDVVYKKKTYEKFFASVVERGLHDCHFGLCGKEERTFWGKGEYQLDHFFVDDPTAALVRKCEVVTTAETQQLSDHSPLVLELG
jgi:endonuclease/exonuclease/phosphatase family metal-dependent hydrolase